jgi:hypothetical protein
MSIKFTHFQNNKGDQAAVGPVEIPSLNKGNAHISLPEVEVAGKASVFYGAQYLLWIVFWASILMKFGCRLFLNLWV